MGPIIGPKIGPKIHEAIAAPRFSLAMISASDPAPRASGQHPASPASSRNTIRPFKLGANAHATVNITNKTLKMLYKCSRPYISDRGAITKGPKQYPRRYTETMNEASC